MFDMCAACAEIGRIYISTHGQWSILFSPTTAFTLATSPGAKTLVDFFAKTYSRYYCISFPATHEEARTAQLLSGSLYGFVRMTISRSRLCIILQFLKRMWCCSSLSGPSENPTVNLLRPSSSCQARAPQALFAGQQASSAHA